MSQQFSFRQYAQSDGLTNLAAEYLLLDPGGELWVGTDGGLFRFDGTAFVSYDSQLGLPSESVRGEYIDPAGRLWVALDRGLYVGGVQGFEAVRTNTGPVLADRSLPMAALGPDRMLVADKAHVRELHRENGGLWSSKPFFSAEQLAAEPALDKVVSFFSDGDGTLWMGCDKKLCSFKAGRVRAWGTQEGVPEGSYGAFVLDDEARLWARSSEHLVMRLPAAAAFATNDPPHARLESRIIEPMLNLDAAGRVLTRTAPGIARWEGGHWREFAADNGLSDSVITRAQVDGEGNLWLNPLGEGIWRWRGYDNVESWTRAQGFVSQKVWNIVRDQDGQLLIGTERGCQVLNESAAHIDGCPFEDLPNVEDIALAVDANGGRWWGLGNNELWTVPAHQTHAHQVKFPDGKVAVLIVYFDHGGTGWIISRTDGLYRLDPATEQVSKIELPRPEARVYDITQDRDGTLWVAAAGGILRLSGGRWTLLPIPDADGSPSVYSSVVAMPDGSIWACTFGKGLLHARGPNLEQREWVKPPVLGNAAVYSVRSDARGRLWANTDQGVVIFDGLRWMRFDAEDGLAGNDTEAAAFLSDVDGSAWIGTAVGLTHVRDPDQLLHPQGALDLRIAAARLGNRPLDLQHQTTLDWHADAAFDARFTSHDYSRSPQTEFRYRLLGLSSSWFGSRSPELHLPAIEDGRYRLEVVAVDAPHARQSKVVTLDFVVLPPWWRTTAFRSGVALLIVSLLVLAWRFQLNKLRARRSALEREFKEREALHERATRDALTGLWNRPSILEFLCGELTQAQRNDAPLALALIDVDHFKRINDTYGHHGGDEVLRELAQRLTATIRQNDWLGRYGGEELMVVLPGVALSGAALPVERLRECVAERPFRVQGQDITLTVSIGMAWCESPIDTTHDMISRADTALYAAKGSGRNRVVYPPATRDPNTDPSGSRRYITELRERLRREAGRRS